MDVGTSQTVAHAVEDQKELSPRFGIIVIEHTHASQSPTDYILLPDLDVGTSQTVAHAVENNKELSYTAKLLAAAGLSSNLNAPLFKGTLLAPTDEVRRVVACVHSRAYMYICVGGMCGGEGGCCSRGPLKCILTSLYPTHFKTQAFAAFARKMGYASPGELLSSSPQLAASLAGHHLLPLAASLDSLLTEAAASPVGYKPFGGGLLNFTRGAVTGPTGLKEVQLRISNGWVPYTSGYTSI